MTWFKVDDSLAFHPKFLGVGLAACGLWVRAGAYCAQQLTDGFVPTGIPAAMGASAEEVDALVEHQLWDVAPGGWRFHDWSEYQPTRQAVLEERRMAKERMAAHRARKAAERDAASRSGGVRPNVQANERGTFAVSSGVPTRPDPTRPVVPSELPAAAAAERAGAHDEPPPRTVCDQDMPGELVVLRAALEASRLIVRWDRLTPETATEMVDLVARHGDAPLVRAALQAHRPDKPAAFAQAWLGVWRALPDPGQRLAVVKARCTEYGHDHETVPCRLCAADRKEKRA